jgi:hypothetical protein
MQMPNALFAIALALLALYAIYAAVGAGPGRRKTGWLVLAGGAAGQVANLLSAYSMIAAVLTTAAILLGLWLVRSPEGPVGRV